MEITKQHHKAAKEIVDLIALNFGDDRVIDPIIAISSSARLSGSFTFRSFNFQLENVSPGQAILSEEANEKISIFTSILGGMLSNLGVEIDVEQLDSFPIEQNDREVVDILDLLQNRVVAIMKEANLDYEQMGLSCAIATAIIIKQCQNELEVETGFNSAVFGFIEGVKTYPPDLGDSVGKKKGFFKFWK